MAWLNHVGFVRQRDKIEDLLVKVFSVLTIVAVPMNSVKVNGSVLLPFQSMCHCSNPYNKMYYAYKKASGEACAHFAAGTPGLSSSQPFAILSRNLV